jgi:hypothetical protein
VTLLWIGLLSGLGTPLGLPIHETQAALSESEFHATIDEVIAQWQPHARAHGAELVVRKLWSSRDVNAYVSREGSRWRMDFHGEFARQTEITRDAYVLHVCHELGHHFGGFVFSWDSWKSCEGQSDYFSTHVCARLLWRTQEPENAKSRTQVDTLAKARCDSVWKRDDERNLCYRIATASLALATMMNRVSTKPRARPAPAPRFDTPSAKRRREIYFGHEDAQCRLDTLLAGALCPREFDPGRIPSLNHPAGQYSAAAEQAAQASSCFTQDGFVEGTRPRCWFKSFIDSR